MRKKLYLVRHCEAEGQAFGADLTKVGHRQALELEEFFSDVGIEKIVSSPFKRAVDSIYPLATTRNLEIQIDKRLSERVLSTMDLPDWQDKLKKHSQTWI
ncbi:histidine phosphatase family protein [Ornithinibacillus scapharcae]|uniref:histidine phosphatase family protein n=1 Tax=Ornithinibacillus scapharcae TaxID=1147159 RepID=UPI000225C011